ncbi:class I SAM-dependent methyltransferase [Nonomuraea lactucae]|uniref:class I SAM-dependent methyltransferase n=1 Tax=Nonomuraea lactucae TaxID=2249762 RepID=UPI000DE31F25|nr:methyltransferase domain-containing protein [Nonomuraea lactucae]
MPAEEDRTGVRHPVFARLYPRISHLVDEAGISERRGRLLAGLTGSVVEVGAGHGPNFGLYPPEVSRVVAVEPEATLRERAREAAAGAALAVEVLPGLAERLPVADRGADAVIFCWVLCSVRDVGAALAEARRVLRPHGELRFLEHVRAPTTGMARFQDVLDATVWPRLLGGCHTGRDTEAAIRRAGFTVSRLERFVFPRVRTPMSFHIIGVAAPQ